MQQYFGGGPFQRNLSAKACDLLLIQMDSDILDDQKFRTHMHKLHSINIQSDIEPDARGQHIVRVLEIWSRVAALTEADRRRHVFAPAVESTEAWCIAAFDNKHRNPETLKGDDLGQVFMEVLERSENQQVKEYIKVDKDVKRRKRFCEKHAVGHERIMKLCPHFSRAVCGILATATSEKSGLQ